MSIDAAPRVVVIGVGNALRHDDAAGLEVVRALAQRVDAPAIEVLEHEGEPLGLIELWHGAAAAVIVDAADSGAKPGTVHRIDASAGPAAVELHSCSSTHAVGLGDAIELARELDRLPARVLIYGIEGTRFDAGSGLSSEVRAVVPSLAETVERVAGELAG